MISVLGSIAGVEFAASRFVVTILGLEKFQSQSTTVGVHSSNEAVVGHFAP
jgi:hypothetical protein